MKTPLIHKTIILLVLIIGCGEPEGSCAGGKSSEVSCNNDWTESECDEFNQQQVNGGDWTFSSEPCEEREFTKYCSEYDTYILSSSNCP